jgi:hypothetical protein
MRNFQAQTVAILQISLIQTVNRDDQQRLPRVGAKGECRDENCRAL